MTIEQTTSAELRFRNLRTVLLLATLFLAPLAASFWMYYGGGWRPGGNTNHGELIDPARPLPDTALPTLAGPAPAGSPFTDKWSLVYVGAGSCDAACRRALLVMRQTRLGLNNEMTRVQRVFLSTGACCDREFLEREHAGLLVLDASGAPAGALLAPFAGAGREHAVFIVDPLGNLMMRFDVRQNPKGLLQDVKKLLKLSHIG